MVQDRGTRERKEEVVEMEEVEVGMEGEGEGELQQELQHGSGAVGTRVCCGSCTRRWRIGR